MARRDHMKRRRRSLTGIHVQWPWSQLILNGSKTIETRGYPLPDRLIGVELAIIETPGKIGRTKAGITESRIVGTVVFSGCVRYESKEAWSQDSYRHLVPDEQALFAFGKRRETWGWQISKVVRLKSPVKPPAKKGIVYAKDCKI